MWSVRGVFGHVVAGGTETSCWWKNRHQKYLLTNICLGYDIKPSVASHLSPYGVVAIEGTPIVCLWRIKAPSSPLQGRKNKSGPGRINTRKLHLLIDGPWNRSLSVSSLITNGFDIIVDINKQGNTPGSLALHKPASRAFVQEMLRAGVIRQPYLCLPRLLFGQTWKAALFLTATASTTVKNRISSTPRVAKPPPSWQTNVCVWLSSSGSFMWRWEFYVTKAFFRVSRKGVLCDEDLFRQVHTTQPSVGNPHWQG